MREDKKWLANLRSKIRVVDDDSALGKKLREQRWDDD